MKITIYELLGLIKDGKAPKKIKITGNIYEYDDLLKCYYTKKDGFRIMLGGVNNEINLIANTFNENLVEIIEEEKKLPEKLDLQYKDITKGVKFEEQILSYCDNLQFKINEIIDYLKSKGDK